MNTGPELSADHADHDAELLRILALPERVRRAMRRLVARCPHNRLVLTVYAEGDRVLAVSATDAVEWEWRRRAGHRHSAAWWAEPGSEWAVKCDRGIYRVSGDRVIAAVPPSGPTRNVGVSQLAPPPTTVR